MRGVLLSLAIAAASALSAQPNPQSLPATEGESLSGHRIALAQAVRGRASLVIASFSKDAGILCGEWAKAAAADPALASVTVYQAAMLEQVPGLVRPMIKSAMRKG